MTAEGEREETAEEEREETAEGEREETTNLLSLLVPFLVQVHVTVIGRVGVAPLAGQTPEEEEVSGSVIML